MFPVQCFAPNNSIAHIGVFLEVFNDEEIDRINFFEKILNFVPAEIRGAESGVVNKNIRSCSSSYLPIDDNTHWIWEKIGAITSQANYELFLYNIDHLECLQYLIYEGVNNDHYRWHRDSQLRAYQPFDRKISGILMLSDVSEYDGGEIMIDVEGNMVEEQYENIKLNKGDILFFDSAFSHCVKPVTSGIRKAIVFWARGRGDVK
jgi:PKHD-type hydroxylase